MRRPVQRFGVLCSACMLLACATVEHRALPVGADSAYRMGREHQLARHSVDAVPAEDGWARVELVTGADGLLTLQRTAARTTPATAARAASLEISNGNGVPGLARATSRRVRDDGVRVVRLTNEAGFGVRRTRIEYQPALRAVAQRLARQVQPDAVLVEAPSSARTGLRLVLGHNAGKSSGTL